MNIVFHEGQPRTFKLCILRGDGWGCVVLSDNIVRQIRHFPNVDKWGTTDVIEELKNFVAEEPEPIEPTPQLGKWHPC